MSTQIIKDNCCQLIDSAWVEGFEMGKYYIRDKINKIIVELEAQEQDYINWDNYDAANGTRYAIDAIKEALNE